MACILKASTEGSKGVVTFTTPERDMLIMKDRVLETRIWSLKDRWVVGLHHNWHDHQFVYNPLFDFSMAGEDDLRAANGMAIPLIPMDACNFSPACFRPSEGEKFWDVLYIARAVFFKKIPEFFHCIRQLYDQGHKLRTLLICPVPPFDRKERKTVFYDVRKVYERLFSRDEQRLFALMTLEYGYPFPFDLETLAFFYRSSKIFVHTADGERRCRVAAYAWASGVPVVGMSCVGSLLPKHLRMAPYYYEVSDYPEFPEKIVSALAGHPGGTNEFAALREYFNIRYTAPVLIDRLAGLFQQKGLHFQADHLAFSHLDMRLGRHHGIGEGPNTVSTPLSDFVEVLLTRHETLQCALKQPDPERELERLALGKPRASFFSRILGSES